MTRFRSALYRGELVHVRRDRFARRRFRYPLYVACIDPSELPALHRALRLFSYNRRNLFALDDRDYAAPLDHAGADCRVVTNLKVAGYVFNPVSFFLRYTGAAIADVTAEVNNTYGGRHRYALAGGARADLDDTAGRARFVFAKQFFVSPFLHGPARYQLDVDCPCDGARLAITMRLRGGTPAPGAPADATSFVAHLRGERVALDDRALAGVALRYPLMTAQVIARIHTQAVRLHARGVPYHRPGPDHRPTHLDGTDVAHAV